MRVIRKGKAILVLLISLASFALSFELLLRVVGKEGLRYFETRRTEEMRPWRPYGHYTWDLYSPILGWWNKPNFKTRVPGHKSFNTEVPAYTVVTNAHGLRETREYSYERVPGRVRLLALGDSFTFGVEVEPDEVFTEVLERKMTGAEVINMGVHGYGTDQMLLILKEEGLRYLPDLLLVGFYLADMQRNLLTFRSHNKPRFQLKGGRLVLTNVPVPFHPSPKNPEETAAPLKKELVRAGWGCWSCAWLSRRLELLRGAAVYLGIGEEWRLAEAIFLEMDRASAKGGARLLIVVFPPRSWVKGEFNPLLTWSFGKVMERFSRKSGIPVLDLTKDFRDHYRKPDAGDLYISHWNPEGHRFVAEKIYAYLLKHPELLRRREGPPPG